MFGGQQVLNGQHLSLYLLEEAVGWIVFLIASASYKLWPHMGLELGLEQLGVAHEEGPK